MRFDFKRNLFPNQIYISHYLLFLLSRFEYLRSNVFLRVLLICGLWLLTGILFYTYTQGWTVYNAFFYCINAGLSIGFGNIAEIDLDQYHAFTIVYVLLGSSIVSGAVGYFLTFIIFNSSTTAPTTYTFDTVTFGSVIITTYCTTYFTYYFCIGFTCMY